MSQITAARATFAAGAPIAQLAEAADLKSVQCRFESDWGYADIRSSVLIGRRQTRCSAWAEDRRPWLDTLALAALLSRLSVDGSQVGAGLSANRIKRSGAKPQSGALLFPGRKGGHLARRGQS